ncbi:helix-turn-helix domain-containing protein [Subtercola endophyticus]|uniref:helix-turn-helix domain-containing protein n=1 Tax=Subtercola endophyticus TaxID=2895559 RepID=UPI001E551C7E|nr:helix-turn-helix transcriptional regulator [Subtercola endophyticus]UFS58390.1 helix-turn-helix domain-containing protein [Subtercola endophyticus]
MLRGTINSPDELGRMLQQGRLLKGLTQRELAQELHVTQRYIHEMESGKPTLYADRLFDFIRATGLTLAVEIDEGEDADG